MSTKPPTVPVPPSEPPPAEPAALPEPSPAEPAAAPEATSPATPIPGIVALTDCLLHMAPEPGLWKGKQPLEARRPFIEAATAFSATRCGRDPQMAHAKWTRVLHGLKSPCTLVDPELYVVSVTNWCTSNERPIMLDSLQGYIRVPYGGRDLGLEYRVALPSAEDEGFDQHLFLIVLRRYGQANLNEDEAARFWSHNVVILETADLDPQADGMAFVYSLDVGLRNDGTVAYEPASMYLVREDDPRRRSGRRVVDDRTNYLEEPTNLMAILTECARSVGVPLHGRVNRKTNEEQRQDRLMASARALAAPHDVMVGGVPAGGNGSGVNTSIRNPFAP